MEGRRFDPAPAHEHRRAQTCEKAPVGIRRGPSPSPAPHGGRCPPRTPAAAAPLAVEPPHEPPPRPDVPAPDGPHRRERGPACRRPPARQVGLTEAEAREQGLDLAVARHEYGDTAFGWALEADDRHGEAAGYLVKLLADRATGRLVGAHLLGPQASLLVQPLIQAMSFDQPVADLARGQYWIHPALTEVVENALLALAGELAG